MFLNQPYSHITYYGILSNPKYAGVCTYARYNYNRISTGVKEKNDNPVWIEDGCSAIVERGAWEDVQKMMKSRHRVFNCINQIKIWPSVGEEPENNSDGSVIGGILTFKPSLPIWPC
ncbi:hypothetical protein FACS1894204_13820 [Synergistales bacterium]|nr:hypothetical protein FACS1894204_13820 [Synergistales bacterium]